MIAISHRSSTSLALLLVTVGCQHTPELLPDRSAQWPHLSISTTPLDEAAVDNAGQDAGDDSDWQFTVTPYLWLAGQNGDVGVGPLEADIDLSFGDILEDLEVALMLGAEARHGDWAILVDGTYLRTKDEGSLGNGVPSEATVESTMIELDLAYRPGEQEVVELLAGARFWSLGLDLEVGAGNTDRRREWVDPVVGGRARIPLNEDLTVQLRGDIGGFGVGSDLSFQLLAALLYSIGESASIGLGYRHIDVDYQSGSFDYDVSTSGPILGLAWGF